MQAERRPWGALVIGVLLAASVCVRALRPPPAPPEPAPQVPQVLSAEPVRGQWAALIRGGPVDINRAPPQVLRQLPGIGPTLAARIVEHRRAHGPFTDARSLTRVRGLGERSVKKLSGHVVFRGRAAEPVAEATVEALRR